MDTWEMTEEVYSTHIEPMIQRLVDKGLLPGVSLGFVTGGEVLFTRHYGFTNLENKTPPNDSSIYGIGSLAKSFTALTLLRMQEEGLVHVDDPIDMFFPFHLEDREIAIRHLLSHSSGIPNIGSALLVLSQDKSPFLPDLPEISIPFRSIEDYFAHLEHVKDYILFNLGEKFYYFNGGYTFLGEIISKVSGISYPQAFRKFVAEPMGLVDTVATLDEADHVRVVQAYGMKPGPDGVEALTGQHLNHPLAQAGGGILSTTTDMLRYVNHLLVSDFIPRNLREEMMRIHAKADTNESPEVFGLKGKHGYGYGWGINENFGGYVMVSHGGSTGVSSSYVSMIPDRRTGYVIMANCGMPATPEILHYLNSFIVGQKPSPPWKARNELYAKLAGTYSFLRDIPLNVVIEVKSGLLYAKSTLPPLEHPLIPINNEFSAFDSLEESNGMTRINFYHEMPEGRMPLFFTIRGEEIFFHYERNVFKKVTES